MISEIGLMQSFTTNDPDTHLRVFQRLQDMYHQTALEKIKGGRLRTYALFKTSPGFEKYLDGISCVKERTALRFCPFCPNTVEDEKHFLLKCQTYKYLRSDLYSEVKNIFPSICNQPHDYRFLVLMRDVNAGPVSRFAFRAMELREFLLASYRTHDYYHYHISRQVSYCSAGI